MMGLARRYFWRSVFVVVMAARAWATFLRFWGGLGASTNLSDQFRWGNWTGFDVLYGVGLAAGGFALAATVHIFNIKSYHGVVRPAILTAFLGCLLVVALMFDLGHPYRIWHPLIMWNPPVGDVRGGPVRDALHHRALLAIPAHGAREIQAACGAEDHEGGHAAHHHRRRDPVHPAPEFAGQPVHDRAQPASPAVVDAASACAVVHFGCGDGPGNDHFRELAQLEGVRAPARVPAHLPDDARAGGDHGRLPDDALAGPEPPGRTGHAERARHQAVDVRPRDRADGRAESLLESELFGHERGAFTGAQARKKGKFEVADGGTVFLDEISDISLRVQTDLLRVLQEKAIVRVGDTMPIKVDFRAIAATNKPLERLVEERVFRPDLCCRLNVFSIHIPPLRERKEDIPLPAAHFLEKLARQMNRAPQRLAPETLELLMRHDWPGNVRELENAMGRALLMRREGEMKPEGFPFPMHPSGPLIAAGQRLEDVERVHIGRILAETRWNLSWAARILDIDRTTLYNKTRKYGLCEPAGR